MLKATERRLPDGFLADADAAAAHAGVRQAKGGLAVVPRGALEHLAGGDRAAPDRRVGQRIEGIEKQAARVGGGPGRPKRSSTELIPVIEHAKDPPIFFVPVASTAQRVVGG